MFSRYRSNGSSSSTSKNLYANKLQVNRLQANDLKVRNLKDESPQESLLFSLAIKEGTWTGSVLNVNTEYLDLIIFSDRPFRYQKQTKSDALNILNTLFSEGGNNSFNQDPPNAVLLTSDGQEVYIVKSFTYTDDMATFNLIPEKDENQLPPANGQMSLFIDGDDNCAGVSPIHCKNFLFPSNWIFDGFFTK